MKAGDVDLESLRVEPPDELRHLPLGPAGFERGHENGNRRVCGQIHRPNLSKAGATLGFLIWVKQPEPA